MKVLFREEWEISSYLDLLARRLETRNIPVRTSTSLRRFAAKDCDIVHYHIPQPGERSEPWRRALWITYFALQVIFYKATGKRIVWTAHDLTDRTYETRERAAINDYLLYTADAIICHCRRVRDALIARRPQVTERIFVVPHPTLVGVSQEATPAGVAREALGIPLESRVFLLFGTVRRYKGARAFIDVFGEHASQHDFLLIAGHARDEDEAAHVEEAAHRDPRIRFYRGFVPLDRTHLFFSAADIVVLPYERITTSGVGPLAMGFGKPLLASDLGCIGEILHDRGGWKVPAGDREALGRALSAASRASAEALDAMGRFNQSESATWTWDRNVDCHVEVYETVLGRVPPARPSTCR